MVYQVNFFEYEEQEKPSYHQFISANTLDQLKFYAMNAARYSGYRFFEVFNCYSLTRVFRKMEVVNHD